jgi:hypothetical protein
MGASILRVSAVGASRVGVRDIEASACDAHTLLMRILFLASLATITTVVPVAAQPARVASVDHIILGIDTLERGIRLLREKTGVTPVMGGVHPGRGTQNALMSLGRGVYLELIAPNFADTAALPRVAFFSQFKTLTPYGWAMGTTSADSLSARVAARGWPAASVAAGSRARPDGSTLAWRTTVPWPRPFGSYLPFYIEWSATSPHPSTQSPSGCTLATVRMTSPAPDSLRALLARGEVVIPVVQGATEGLQFDLDCPRGRVEFR